MLKINSYLEELHFRRRVSLHREEYVGGVALVDVVLVNRVQELWLLTLGLEGGGGVLPVL